MKLKALLLALFVAGLTASMAFADDGPGKGKGNDKGKRGDDSRLATATTSARADDDDDDDRGKRVTCRPSIKLELRGTVAATPTAAAVAVLVTRGGAEGASLAGKQVTFDVSQARRLPTLAQGDTVAVHGRACVDIVAGTVKLVATEVERKRADRTTTSSTSSTTTTTTSSSSSTSTTTTTAR
jgi:hypothetical protein